MSTSNIVELKEGVEKRFIEVHRVLVETEQQASKLRVVIKHRSGAKETFTSTTRGRRETVTFHTFVEALSGDAQASVPTDDTEDETTTIQVVLLDRLHREDVVLSLPLHIGPEMKENSELIILNSAGLKIEVGLGLRKTASEVAAARLDQAKAHLQSKKKMMVKTELVTGCLDLLVTIGSTISEINGTAYVVASVVKDLFEHLKSVPETYQRLCRLAIELADELRTVTEAQKHFDSAAAQNVLSKIIEVIGEVAMKISRRYSSSKTGVFIRGLFSSNDERANELEEQLRLLKERITRVFLTEIKADVSDIKINMRGVQKAVVRVEDGMEWDRFRRLREDEERRLEKLLPPKETRPRAECLEGTRAAIINTVIRWTQETPAVSRLFLLYGVAGCGKSSVAGTICERLGKQLTGSFFCTRDDTTRRNPVRLIQTLAFYLAQKDGPYRDSLLETLRKPELSVLQDLKTQFKVLLEEPLHNVQHLGHQPAFFVVDALDECDDHENVAKALTRVIDMAPWVKIVVTSRQLSEITGTFDMLGSFREEIDLRSENADDDIRRLLEHELGIGGRLADIGPFIKKDMVETLVKKSQGLFIYMETIIKFLVEDGGNLFTVKKLLGQATFPEAEQNLDALYGAVIESAAGMSKISRTIVPLVLGFILASSKTEPLQPRVIHAFLPGTIQVSLSTVEKILKRMSPILVDTGRGIVVSHTSVLDFCADKGRCGEANYADPAEIEQIMAIGCFQIMEGGTRSCERQKNAPSGLHFNMCKLESSHLEDSQVLDLEQRIAENISAELLYSCTNWIDHAMRAGLDGRSSRSGSSGLLSLSQALKSLLCSTLPLFLLEAMNVCGRLDAARGALLRVDSLHLQLGAMESPLVREVAHEINFYIEQCLPSISISTPHLYLSLTWIASESKLWTYWRNEFSRAQILNRPLCYSPGRRLLSFDCRPKVDTYSMSPDGRYLASGSRDGYIRVWDLASGAVVHESQLTANHFGDDSQTPLPIDALAYRPDGGSILCMSGSSIVELDSNTLLIAGKATTIGYRGVRCIAVSTHVAIGLEDGTIAILDAVTLSTVRQWKAHQTFLLWETRRRTVSAIAFDRNGLRLASASSDGTVCIWDAQSGECIKQLYADSTMCSVAFSSDGKRVMSGNWNGDVWVLDAESGEKIGDRWKAGEPVLFLAFSPDDSRIVTAVANYEKEAEEEEEESEGEGEYIWAMQTSIQIWDANVLTRRTTSSPGHTEPINSVAFSPDGKRIVSGSNDCSVRVWDAETGEPVELAVMQHHSAVNFVAFSPDGNRIVSGGDDNVIRIWDAQTGKSIRVLKGHTNSVTCGAYSPDGTKIVSGSDDQTLRLWDAMSGEQIGQPMRGHQKWIMAVCFSPDGSCIASASLDSNIRLWDGHTGEALGEPLAGHDGGVHCIAFSQNGKRIASGGQDKTVCLWDVEKRCCIGEPLKGHNHTVTSVAFSPDANGAFVFSGSLDKTVRCWDAFSGELVGHQLIGHTHYIHRLAISRDGTRIATGSYDRTIRIWDSRAFHWETDQFFAKCGLRGPDRIPAHIPDDGWIRTTDGGLLLWVPPEHRKVVCDTNLFCISMKSNKPIRILWDELRHGEDWTAVRGAS